MPLLTLPEARAQLDLHTSDTAEDAELADYVAAVTAVVERVRGEVVAPREVVDELELTHAGRFRLHSVPVLWLTSLSAVDGSAVWNVADMHAHAGSGVVTVLAGPPVHGLVSVSYQAGYETIPDNYRVAARIILAHLWETQRGGTGLPGFGGLESTPAPGVGYAIPNRARELLGSRVLVG